MAEQTEAGKRSNGEHTRENSNSSDVVDGSDAVAASTLRKGEEVAVSALISAAVEEVDPPKKDAAKSVDAKSSKGVGECVHGQEWNDLVPSMSLGELLQLRKDVPQGRKRKRAISPCTPFILYVKEVLDQEAKAHADLKPEQLVAKVEQQWKDMSAQQKHVYEEQSKKDHKNVEAQAEKTQVPSSPAPKRRKRVAPIKTLAKPKHPKSAFLFYASEAREEVKKTASSFADVAKKLGENWKALSDDAKQRFIIMADNDKVRYRRELEEYKSAPLAEEPLPPPEPVLVNSDVKTRRRKHPLAPKHPLSAYLFFVATHRASLTQKFSQFSFSDVAKMLGLIWKKMPKHEKCKYEILAIVDKRRYKYEMKDWQPPPDEDVKDTESTESSPPPPSYAAGKGQRSRVHPPSSSSSSKPSIEWVTESPSARAAALVIADLSRHMRQPRVHTGSSSAAAKAKVSSTKEYTSAAREATRQRHAKAQSSAERNRIAAMAFSIFAKAERQAVLLVHPTVDRRELKIALKQKWRELSEHEKAPFVQESEELFEKQRLIAAKETTERLELQESCPSAVSASSNAASSFEHWDSNRVGAWIADIGLGHHAAAFSDSGLTGADLVHLNTAALKNELGVKNLGERKKIRAAIDELTADPRQKMT